DRRQNLVLADDLTAEKHRCREYISVIHVVPGYSVVVQAVAVVVQGFSPAHTRISYFKATGMISNRPQRLAGVSYTGWQRYFLTFRTNYRRRVFEDARNVETALLQLRRSAERHHFALFAYCFMPDHVHLLVYGEHETSDVRAFVALFKQLTGYYYKQS